MNYSICSENAIKYIDQIQALGDKNSSTLGFMPAEAFKQFAKDGYIFYALQEKMIVAYALFRIQKRKNAIVLTHLCVSDSCRGTGIAKELVDTLCQKYSTMRYIEARCRRDYNLDDFWKKCGFNVLSEKDGRKKSGSTLTIWRREIDNRNLLNLIYEEESQEKIVAALDTNIIVLLHQGDKETQFLMDDYLHDYIAYRITPECKNEINKNQNPVARRKLLQFLNQFDVLGHDQAVVAALTLRLTDELDPLRNKTGDIRHLAFCIAAEADVLVTRDDWLCKQAEHCRKEYGIDILRPEELYLEIEEISENNLYSPECMMGSRYTEENFRKEDARKAYNLHQETGQKKAAFQKELLSWVTNEQIRITAIKQNNELVGLYAIRTIEYSFELILFAFDRKALKKAARNTLMRFVLNRIVYKIAKDADQCTGIIVKKDIVENNRDIFNDCGFIPFEEGMIHLCLNGVCQADEALEYCSLYLHSLKDVIDQKDIDSTISNITSIARQNILSFEKLLGASVILQNSALPTYFVPVMPIYAAKLFDEDLAAASMLVPVSEHEQAVLSIENSFFSASRHKLEAPCRILWYVSEDKRYCNVKALRACSVMSDVDSGTLKELYNQHRKYGVLNWEEITTLFQAAPTKRIQAFRFESTCMFKKNMTCAEFKKLYLSRTGKEPNLQGPFKLDSVLAQDVLKFCMGG